MFNELSSTKTSLNAIHINHLSAPLNVNRKYVQQSPTAVRTQFQSVFLLQGLGSFGFNGVELFRIEVAFFFNETAGKFDGVTKGKQKILFDGIKSVPEIAPDKSAPTITQHLIHCGKVFVNSFSSSVIYYRPNICLSWVIFVYTLFLRFIT